MRHKDYGFVPEGALDAVLEDMLRSVVVDGREGVVEQHDIAAKVGTARKVKTLALSTRQVDATQTSL